MGTNKYMFITLFFASLFLLKCECKKLQIDCTQVKYNFQLPVKAYPDQDTINIGDTIWLEINESVTLKNTDGNLINYGGAANLGSAIGFSYRDTILKQWVDAVNKFSFYLMKGTELKVTSLDVEYRFSEQNSMYIFKLGVIPKQKGLYSLLLSNSNNTYRNSDKCTKANFSIIFQNTNQHYSLSPFYIPGTNPTGGDYYFFVR